MSNSVVLVGGFSEIIELCKDSDFESIFVIDKIDVGLDTTYLGSDQEFFVKSERYNSQPFIITPDNPKARKDIFREYSRFTSRFINLISKNAKISSSSQIGIGNVIQYGVYISANVRIGDFVKLNVNACVMHDSQIGSFSTIAPCSTILGRVRIGENCYIGSMATVLPEIIICDNVTIGAGAVVTKNIFESGVYVGVPAKKIK